MANQFTARVDGRQALTSDIFRLTILAPEVAERARPGQFVMLRCGDNLDPLLNRPLSIHQRLPDGKIQVLFKVFGEGTRRLAALAKGDSLQVVGPLGRSFSLLPEEPVCLIGGGLGIAPLFFLASELLSRHPQAPRPQMLLGARTAAELAPLAQELGEKLGLDPHLATDDGSGGHHGLVTDLIADRLESGGKYQVYCCGPTPMMAAVARLCGERGWPCQVSLETMMACGISACLGCAVKGSDPAGGYLHVCKDGPVFDAEKVGWR